MGDFPANHVWLPEDTVNSPWYHSCLLIILLHANKSTQYIAIVCWLYQVISQSFPKISTTNPLASAKCSIFLGGYPSPVLAPRQKRARSRRVRLRRIRGGVVSSDHEIHTPDAAWQKKHQESRIHGAGKVKIRDVLYAGWWFGTSFMFPRVENSNPNWLILKPRTSIWFHVDFIVFLCDA